MARAARRAVADDAHALDPEQHRPAVSIGVELGGQGTEGREHRLGRLLDVGIAGKGAEHPADHGLYAPLQGLQHDVAGEAVGHHDVHPVAHHVPALDVADEVARPAPQRPREQGVGLFHQGVALGRLLADGQDADPGLAHAEALGGQRQPIWANWTSIGAVQSTLAPESIRMVGVDPGTGMTVAMAGRETPGRRPIRNKALAMVAPVLPALTMAQARPSRTASAQRTSEESRFTRTARPGSSSIPMTSARGQDLHPGLRRQSAQVGGVADQQHGDAELLRCLTRPGHHLGRRPVAAHGVDSYRKPVKDSTDQGPGRG